MSTQSTDFGGKSFPNKKAISRYLNEQIQMHADGETVVDPELVSVLVALWDMNYVGKFLDQGAPNTYEVKQDGDSGNFVAILDNGKRVVLSNNLRRAANDRSFREHTKSMRESRKSGVDF